MATQSELDAVYMQTAEAHAKLSKAVRKKVGAALVTSNGVILAGCNGMAPSGSNECEYVDSDGFFVTKPETIHAELSCILKAAREGVSVVGSTLYVTLSCCKPCSEMVAAAGIKRVVYKEAYRDVSGIENLVSLGVCVEKMEE
jgi:dCMP deaminase